MLLAKDGKRVRKKGVRGLTLCLSLAICNAGRVGVCLRAVRYRGGNSSGCRRRRRGRSCGRRRVRTRGALLLLGVLQIARIQQWRKISRLIHATGDDAVVGGSRIYFVCVFVDAIYYSRSTPNEPRRTSDVSEVYTIEKMARSNKGAVSTLPFLTHRGQISAAYRILQDPFTRDAGLSDWRVFLIHVDEPIVDRMTKRD